MLWLAVLNARLIDERDPVSQRDGQRLPVLREVHCVSLELVPDFDKSVWIYCDQRVHRGRAVARKLLNHLLVPLKLF